MPYSFINYLVMILQDNVQNKKVIFSDSEAPATKYDSLSNNPTKANTKNLFEGNDSGDELNFDIKKHYEGKKGQKVNCKIPTLTRSICN